MSSSDSTCVPQRSKFYLYHGFTDSGTSCHASAISPPQKPSQAIHGDGGSSCRQPAARPIVHYEERPCAPRRKYANVGNEERRKALAEHRGRGSPNTGSMSGADLNCNKGAQLRSTPGSRGRKSNTKDSQSKPWSCETKDSGSTA